MNYQKIYNKLVSNKRDRSKTNGIYESHHIKPRSLGGSNSKTNLVLLTPREHFIAHLLLSKIYGGKMTYALYIMSSKKKYTNRVYGKLREHFVESICLNEDRGSKISKALTGKKKSEKHKINWKESRSKGCGWSNSDEQKRKLSQKLSGDKNPMWGQTHNENSKKIISEANKQKITCPHCNREGGIAIMKRWHFDRCRQKLS